MNRRDIDGIEEEFQLVLNNSIINFQKTFDISPDAVNCIFQSDKNGLIKKFHEYMAEAGKELKIRLLKSVPTDYYLDEDMWNVENCGHIQEVTINGYTKYCNIHKYLHGNDKESLAEHGHKFISKSPTEILGEKNRQIKFGVHQKIMWKSSVNIHDHAKRYINEKYSIYTESTGGNNKEKVLDWLRSHPSSFKKRDIIYHEEGEKFELYINEEDNASYVENFCEDIRIN